MSIFNVGLNNLTEEEQERLYGRVALRGIPQNMQQWDLELKFAPPTQYGHFVAVQVGTSTLEQHHQIMVIDEYGNYLPGIGVGFFYPGGNGPGAPRPDYNYWDNSPISNPAGNYQITSENGYAQHTFNTGGETIVCWHIENGVMKYSSTSIHNAIWKPTRNNSHTGIRVIFQLRRANVDPVTNERLMDMIRNLDNRLKSIEQLLSHN